MLDFVDEVADLRNPDAHHEKGILELAIRFRDRVAGNPRDKILGYLGLAQESAFSLILEKPYDKTAADLFSHFSASCIDDTGSLAIMTIAEGLAVHRNTWAVDWEKMTSPQWKHNDPAALDNIPDHQPPHGILERRCASFNKFSDPEEIQCYSEPRSCPQERQDLRQPAKPCRRP